MPACERFPRLSLVAAASFVGLFLESLWFFLVGVVDGLEDGLEAGADFAVDLLVLARPIGAADDGPAVGHQEHRQRPAAAVIHAR